MSIITLTTDLGLKDYYVSSIKGAIYKQISDATIVDITHDINKFDIAQAAFVVKNIVKDFPKGTIHLIGVLPQITSDTNHLVIKHYDQYFIGADNGMFSLLFDTKPDQIVELNISQATDIITFPTKDVFVNAACHIIRGGTLEVIGKTIDTYREKISFKPVIDANHIRGSVLYIDSYGNVITNISERLFKEVGKGREFVISVRHTSYDIHTLSNDYQDVAESERLALFGSTGYLEIAINIGNAHKLLGLGISDIVSVIFHDH